MCMYSFLGKMLQRNPKKILLQTNNTKFLADLKLKTHGCALCITYLELPHLVYKFPLSDALNQKKNPKREIR